MAQIKNGYSLTSIRSALTITIVALFLGFLTTSQYVRALGFPYLETEQLRRHQMVIDGNAGNPWQYRVLAPYILEFVFRFYENRQIPYSIAGVFISFRLLQDIVIMVLAYVYYRKLGGSSSQALTGVAIMAWGISYAHFDSDLQFNTYFDLIFYLLAGICLLRENYVWIIPITLLSALNRETSAFIPILPLLYGIFITPDKPLRPILFVVVPSLIIYLIVFFGLRWIYGEQPLFIPYGYRPGFDLLQYNLLRGVTWERLLTTLSIIPMIALINYRRWSSQLKLFFWVIVPLWMIIHAFASIMAETRLFLVPQVLVFIPGSLILAHNTLTTEHEHALNSQVNNPPT